MTIITDNWVIVKITRPEGVVHKVLAGFHGGYLHGDSWRMNSGILKVEREGDYFLFHGQSGSIYVCHKDAQRLSGATAGIYDSLVKQAAEKNIIVEIVNEFEG